MGGGDVVGTAIVNLKSDATSFLSDLTSALGKGKGLFSDFGSDIAGTMKGAGGIMTAGITAPIVAVGAFAIKSGEIVEDATSSIAKATGQQGAQLASTMTQWKSVYASVPSSAADVTAVITKLTTSLHLQGQELKDTATDVLNYSIATKTSASSDAATFATMTNAAHLAGNASLTAAQLTDMATVAYQKTGVTMDQISPAFNKATASMTAMGLSIPQQIAMLDGLTQAGLKAKQVTTILMGIGPAAKAAGESSSAFWQHMIQDAKDGGTYTAAETKLLGKNADMFTAAAKSGKLSNDQLVASLQNSKGAADKAGEASETFGEKLTKFTHQGEMALAPLGITLINIATKLLDAAGPVIAFVGKLLSLFSEMPEPIQLIVIAIAGIAAAIGPVLMLIGMMAPAIGPIVTILGMMGIEIDMSALAAGGLTGALGGAAAAAWAVSIPIMGMELPLIAIIAAVVVIGAILYLLYTRFKPFHDAVQAVLGWAKNLVSTLQNLNWGSAFSGVVATVESIGGKLWNSIVSAVGGFGSWLWSLISDLPSKLWSAYIGIWTQIGSWLWGEISGLAEKAWNTYIGIWTAIGSWLWGLISPLPGELWGGLQSALGGFGNWLWNQLTSIPGKLESAINAIWSDVANAFVNALKGAVSGAASSIVSPIQNAISSLHLPALPAAQHGGIVTKPTLLIAGEAGPEAITPLSNVSGGGFSVNPGSISPYSPGGSAGQGQGNVIISAGAIQINNPILTSNSAIDTLSTKIGYKVNSEMRRAGLSKG
jgi:phage-related minor tail protein